MQSASDTIVAHHLWWKILLGMVLGALLGVGVSESLLPVSEGVQSMAVAWIALPGEIFLALLQMVIIPLVVTSIILGIADSGGAEFVGRAAARLVPYFLMTTAIAVTMGLSLAYLIEPGSFMASEVTSMAAQKAGSAGPDAEKMKMLQDLTGPERIMNLIPVNPFQAAVERNLLQIVIAAILAGLAAASLSKELMNPFFAICRAVQGLSMQIIAWAMLIAPVAVFGLMTRAIAEMGTGALGSVGIYALTVLGGLVGMLGVYTLLARWLGGKKIGEFWGGVRTAQLVAFSTSSSAATMPVSIQVAESQLKLRPEIGRFVVPLGATINMDGTALYQAVATVFLAQAFGVDLSAADLGLVLLTTIGASIGTPALPGVGLVVLSTILLNLGIPEYGVAIILGVDRLLDMCRTAVNVTGDLTAATVLNRWMK